jgi:beta-N-acetylhexosaminidase
MTSHVVVPALDDRPATMSRRVLLDLLRGELGFTGAIVTDALDMKGASGTRSIGEAAAAALAAGADLLCLGARQDEAYIRQSILDPNAVIAEGFPPGLMPPDLGQKMTGAEFERLVQWLKDHKGPQTQ